MPLLGIDLGTTQCAIACLDEHGRPRLLANALGAFLTPSVVQARPDGTCLVGAEAKAEIVLAKADTAAFFKRDMGSNAHYVYGGREWTPVTLSAAVLAQLKADAEAALGQCVERAVITVPAYFQDAARQATFEAGRLAGLEVLQVLNEPTAAAIAAAQLADGGGSPQRMLVYDLGGGTFDVSVVELAKGQLSVLASDGNHTLGGKDWDDRLLRHVAEQFQGRFGCDPLDEPYAFQELAVRVEEAKKALSLRERAAIVVSAHGHTERFEVQRATFEALTQDLLLQTEALTHQVLRAVGLDARGLDAVVLAGGSTRMPMVPALLGRLWGRPPLQTVDPDACVALGAALYAGQLESAATLAGGLCLRIHDAISHSLGMVAVSPDGERYLNSRLIPKHHLVPVSVQRPFAVPPRADTVAVYVTQGESDSPFEVEFVGKYAISGLGRAQDVEEVEIRYAYDESGRVQVSAFERGTLRELAIEKQPLPEDMSWLARGPKAARGQPKTVYLVIDLSGSMSGKPLAKAQTAMRQFIANSVLETTAIGVMVVADQVQVVQAATQDAAVLQRAIERLRIGLVGGGNGADPFRELGAALESAPGDKFAVVLADGVWSQQPRAIERARACHAQGIQVAAIGFGCADERFLRAIASCDEAALYTRDLTGAFEHIARELNAGRGITRQR